MGVLKVQEAVKMEEITQQSKILAIKWKGWREEGLGGGGHLGIFWVGMCHPGLQIGTPF